MPDLLTAACFALLVVHTRSVNPMRNPFFFFRGGESAAADVVGDTNINSEYYEEYDDDDDHDGWDALDAAPSRWRGCDENYVVGAEIGSGKYSHVFAGTRRRDNASVAIKVLKPPTPLWKVRREVRVLRELRSQLLHFVQQEESLCAEEEAQLTEETEAAVRDALAHNMSGPRHQGKGVASPKGPRHGIWWSHEKISAATLAADVQQLTAFPRMSDGGKALEAQERQQAAARVAARRDVRI